MIEAILLGIIQGLTEFIPVSSTAHLILAERWLGTEAGGLTFDVALHGGTLLAVLVYFRKELLDVARLKDRKLGVFLVLGTMPAAVLGLTLRDVIATTLREPWVVAVALIVVGIAIIAVERWARGAREMDAVTVKDGVLVGCFQALALVPGTSRSGATIAGGLTLGLSRPAAVRLSFLLGVPAIGGAFVLESRKLLHAGFGEVGAAAFAAGVITAAVTGYACIAFLLRYVRTRTLLPFMLYRIALGVVVLLAA